MARMSKQAKAVSNTKILDEAARLFRENGIESTGVAEIMKAAGLTHGGFYRHFKSKEDLAIAAIGQSMDQTIERYQGCLKEEGAQTALILFIRRYLSLEHVQSPGVGCPIAALGAEAARGDKIYKKPLETGYQKLLDLMAMGVGDNTDDRKRVAADIFSILVGTIVIARTFEDKVQTENILATGLEAAQHRLGLL